MEGLNGIFQAARVRAKGYRNLFTAIGGTHQISQLTTKNCKTSATPSKGASGTSRFDLPGAGSVPGPEYQCLHHLDQPLQHDQDLRGKFSDQQTVEFYVAEIET
ncbi:hypothetical protein DFAR_1460009 [Desulfarculales bacterium]